eukprot:jgi/Mesvir1/7711/Mv11663-RA.13
MASLTSSFLTGSQLKVASFQSASLSQGKKLGRGVPGLKPVPARAPVVACLAPKSTNDLSAAPKEEAANAVMELSSTSLLRGFEAPLRNLMSSVGMVPAAAPGTPSAGLNLGTILVLAAAIVSSAAQMANAATNPSSMGAAIDESLGHLAHGAPDASMGAQLQKAGAALPLIAAAGLNAGELSSTVSRLAPTVLPLAVGGSLATVGWTMLSKARSSSARPVALIQREADILNKAQKVVEANNMTRTFEEALADRTAVVGKYYPGATNLEDFISRAEVALFENGFVGENTIACLNVCRDEVCEPMREAVEDVFGSSFMVNGLGGMLTCGVTGVKAGISHSPVLGGRERYVFFSFPHIAIDSSGKVGAIHRPGRGQESTACGAMIGALGTIKANGVEPECKVKGVHEPHDCEFSICRARMARTLKAKGMNPADVDLVKFTAAAEERITHDLEDLIMDAVDTSKADYAVITGIQIHAWEAEANEKELLEGGNKDRHDFEFVLPGKAYCVINGERKEMDLSALPALTPRMITLMRNAKMSKEGPSGGRFAMPTAAGATVATRLLTDRKTIQVASTVPPPRSSRWRTMPPPTTLSALPCSRSTSPTSWAMRTLSPASRSPSTSLALSRITRLPASTCAVMRSPAHSSRRSTRSSAPRSTSTGSAVSSPAVSPVSRPACRTPRPASSQAASATSSSPSHTSPWMLMATLAACHAPTVTRPRPRAVP